jgi:hypothetical protein
MVEVESLYKKSSINLFLVGGLFFLLVNCGVHELFKLMPEKGYAGGELVVLMISLAKLYTMFLGNNGAIITNSKFYRITLPIGVGSAIAVYFLNRLFYYELEMGTNGLALATLIIILIFNSVKLYFVKSKFSMSPFTDKSWKLFFIILLLMVSFYFWNFSIPLVEVFDKDISPILNIIFKSLLIIICYLFLIFKLSISEQINTLLRKYIKL